MKFFRAIPIKNYSTMQYSSRNSNNELFRGAIFFVQYRWQNIRQWQLYVWYNRSNIPQCDIFRAKPLMKHSAVQYPPCKTTMQMLTMRCHCRDIPLCNTLIARRCKWNIPCIITTVKIRSAVQCYHYCMVRRHWRNTSWYNIHNIDTIVIFFAQRNIPPCC